MAWSWSRRLLAFAAATAVAAALLVAVVAVIALRLDRSTVVGPLLVQPLQPTLLPFVKPDPDELAARAEAALAAAATAEPPTRRVRNLILVLGDGVGLSSYSIAAATVAGPDPALAVESAPVVGLVRPASVTSLIPDSAAAATALASGLPTLRGVLGQLPDGRPLRTLFEAAAGLGLTTAIVSNGGLVDATPAGFATHTSSRSDIDGILRQHLAAPTSILVGSDWRLAALAEAAGHGADIGALVRARARPETTVATTLDDLLAATPPVVGVLAAEPGQETFSAPLETIAAATLDHLEDAEGGFAVVIESETADVAAHRHQAATAVAAVLELDRVVAVAAELCRRRDDTLLVVLSDHDTGGLTMIGGRYDFDAMMVRWASDNHTGEWVPLFAFGAAAEELAGVHSTAEVGRILARLLGVHPFPALREP